MTINQLLTEMGGFRESDGVLVIAATNLKEVLDPALIRPGRFDLQLESIIILYLYFIYQYSSITR